MAPSVDARGRTGGKCGGEWTEARLDHVCRTATGSCGSSQEGQKPWLFKSKDHRHQASFSLSCTCSVHVHLHCHRRHPDMCHAIHAVGFLVLSHLPALWAANVASGSEQTCGCGFAVTVVPLALEVSADGLLSAATLGQCGAFWSVPVGGAACATLGLRGVRVSWKGPWSSQSDPGSWRRRPLGGGRSLTGGGTVIVCFRRWSGLPRQRALHTTPCAFEASDAHATAQAVRRPPVPVLLRARAPTWEPRVRGAGSPTARCRGR